jgi:hypothetical protein
VSDGRIATLDNGNTEISIFIVGRDGRKITETSEQRAVCKRMKTEVEHPLRINVVTRGPDTELLVATPIESCGKGRPRVLYDVTLALKMLDICIFKVGLQCADAHLSNLMMVSTMQLFHLDLTFLLAVFCITSITYWVKCILKLHFLFYIKLLIKSNAWRVLIKMNVLLVY